MTRRAKHSGRYRDHVTIQKDTGTTEDAAGQHVESWTNLFSSVPAELDTGGSRKFYAAQQVHKELTHLVTTRFLNTLVISDKLRIAWGSRTLNLLGPPIDVLNRRHEYEFRCVEHVG